MTYGIKKVSENVMRPGRGVVLLDPFVKDNDNFELGTLRVDRGNKSLNYKLSKDTFVKFDASTTLIDGTVIERLIRDSNVTEVKIKDQNVTTRKIKDLNVTTQKIENFAVIEQKIGPNAVTTTKIKDFNVTNPKLAEDSVSTSKIIDGSIITTKIKDQNVTTSKIRDYAITDIKLGTDSVTTRSIKDRNITSIKIEKRNILSEHIATEQIETTHLVNQAVTTAKIADAAITEIKIENNAITTPKIMNESITNEKIANSAVTTDKIADLTITTDKIANFAITKDKVDAQILAVLDNAVLYDSENNVNLKNHLHVAGNIHAEGDIRGARVYNMVYVDLAEGYIPGEELSPGMVVEYAADDKVYKSGTNKNSTVVGVVSDEFAICFGADKEDLDAKRKVAITLAGKVHVIVKGNVKIGDKLVAGKNGMAEKAKPFDKRTVIGKVLNVNPEDKQRPLCLLHTAI